MGIKYPCDQCKKEFSSNSKLKGHIMEIHGIVLTLRQPDIKCKYTCSQCDYQFSEQESLKQHKLGCPITL